MIGRGSLVACSKPTQPARMRAYVSGRVERPYARRGEAYCAECVLWVYHEICCSRRSKTEYEIPEACQGAYHNVSEQRPGARDKRSTPPTTEGDGRYPRVLARGGETEP